MTDSMSVGYCGDDECDDMADRSTTSLSSDDNSVDEGSRRNNDNEQFFANLPSRRKGDVDDLQNTILTGKRCDSNLNASQYYVSQMLVQYFADQKLKPMKTSEQLDFSNDSRLDEEVLMRVKVPMITAGRQVLIEEAISFSKKPRYEHVILEGLLNLRLYLLQAVIMKY
jgi:hypothetical protein